MKGKQNNQKIQRLVKYLGAFITVVVIIVGVILIINNQETTYNDAVPRGVLGVNVATKGTMTKDDRLIVFATNNNDVPVDIDLEVDFYDKKGTLVGTDTDAIRAVGVGANVAVEMYQIPEEWNTYKIVAKAEKTNETSYADKITVNHSDNGENINVKVTNNSDDTIEYITVGVVYYQDNEVVGYDFGIEPDIETKGVANFEIYYPYDSDDNNIEFNNYKVFVNEAFTYNYDEE